MGSFFQVAVTVTVTVTVTKTNGHQSFLGLWRRCETDELLTIPPHGLIASDWRNASTYKPLVDHPLFVLAGSGAEDPSNIWTTKTNIRYGRWAGCLLYHAIFHDEQATRCMLGSCGGQGRTTRREFGRCRLEVQYATVNAYNRYFSFTNNGTTTTLRADTRVRPHIVINGTTDK